MTRLAVYSVLFGASESLVEQPVAEDSDAEFHLFTDDPSLVSTTWNVHLVEPRFPADPIRSARSVKIVGRPELADFETTLWIDNRIELSVDPVRLVASWLAEHDIAVLRHSFRETVFDEFDEVARLGYDEPARVYEQLIHYTQLESNALGDRPFATGVMARRWTSQVRAAMEQWMAHVLRYSRRDQLSVGQVLKDAELRPFVIAVDNVKSEFHTWRSRSEVGRGAMTGRLRPGDSFRHPLLRLKETESALAEALTAAAEREADLLARLENAESRAENAQTAADQAPMLPASDQAELVSALRKQVAGLERLVLELARSSVEREVAAERLELERAALRNATDGDER